MKRDYSHFMKMEIKNVVVSDKLDQCAKNAPTLRAWITGRRRDQSPGTRTSIPLIQLDPSFKGTDERDLLKCNPLANTSSSEVLGCCPSYRSTL